MKKPHVASFDVDPQNTFTPICPNELPVPGGHEIAGELNENAQHAKIRILSRDGHPQNATWVAESPDQVLTPVGMPNVDVRWPEHGVIGTLGFDLISGLPHPITGYDFAITKGIDHDCHPYGACYHDLANTRTTGVIEFLKSKGITHVIVGGLALEYCVKTTIEQLVDAGFSVILNKASTRAVTEQGEIEAIHSLTKTIGVTVINDHSDLEWALSKEVEA